MSFKIKLGNFLYNNSFCLYKPLYTLFKNRQDAFEIELLKKYIHGNNTVLDIGANIGFYTKVLASIVGEKGEVHCFEPDKINFGHLKRATENLNNVFINNQAVGPETGILKIYTSKELNVDHRTYKPERYDEEIEIEAVSIDDYVSAISSERSIKIDFIKMDIQGFEMQAMKGMKKTLDANEEIKLISEFWPYGLKKAGSSLSEYYNFLTVNGFKCFLLEHKSLKPLSPEAVKALEPLGEKFYFNIFAERNHV